MLSSDNYLNLLISKNKNLYPYINGTIHFSEIFFDRIFRFCYPLVIIFVLGLNFYTCILSYVFISYQFVIFIMTISAIINVYMFSGIMISIFFIIPVNLLFFSCLIVMSVICLERSSLANRTKYFKEAYDRCYFSKVALCFLFMAILSLFIAFILPLLLKSAIFFIFW